MKCPFQTKKTINKTHSFPILEGRICPIPNEIVEETTEFCECCENECMAYRFKSCSMITNN